MSNQQEERYFYIYKHTCLTTGLSYIGCTSQLPVQRWGKNGRRYTAKDNRKLNEAITLYGWDNFTHTILEEGYMTKKEAYEKEVYYISLYDSFNNGYNLETGGIYGKTVSDETKKKHIVQGFSHRITDDGKRRISESVYKRNIGTKHTEETKQKMSLHNARCHNIICTNITSGEEIEFKSFIDCCKYLSKYKYGKIVEACKYGRIIDDTYRITSKNISTRKDNVMNKQEENLIQILDTYLEEQHHLNVNVFNRDTLLDAQAHPEKYPQLTVRVSGYAVNFIKLTKEQQDDVISRTIHESM